MSETKKRVAELISRLEDYKEVELKKVADSFTIVVDGKGIHATDERDFEPLHRNHSYDIGFNDCNPPDGKRISPQMMELSDALNIGTLKKDTIIFLRAERTIKIDGEERDLLAESTLGLKDFESAQSYRNNQVHKYFSTTMFNVSFFKYKNETYLTHVRLNPHGYESIAFSTADAAMNSKSVEYIDYLNEHLSKRAKRLANYDCGKRNSSAPEN